MSHLGGSGLEFEALPQSPEIAAAIEFYERTGEALKDYRSIDPMIEVELTLRRQVCTSRI